MFRSLSLWPVVSAAGGLATPLSRVVQRGGAYLIDGCAFDRYRRVLLATVTAFLNHEGPSAIRRIRERAH